VHAVVALPAVAVLVAVSVSDVRRRVIPNVVIVPAWALALTINILLDPGQAAEWLAWSLGAGLCFLVFALATRGGFGMGDVKLVAFLGAVLGPALLSALAVGTLLGGLAAGLILLRHGRAASRRTVAYGPYLAAGGLVVLLLG
jgi:leader peptidase (prepilin peptidase)/N-methyltransferase